MQMNYDPIKKIKKLYLIECISNESCTDQNEKIDFLTLLPVCGIIVRKLLKSKRKWMTSMEDKLS